MKLEFEATETNPDIKRPYIVPSHEKGYFVIDHSYYGTRLVGRLSLKGVTNEAVDLMERGKLGVDKLFVAAGDDDSLMRAVGIPDHALGELNATITIPGSGNTVNVHLEEFREVAPVSNPNRFVYLSE